MSSTVIATTTALEDLAVNSPVSTCSFDYLQRTSLYDTEKPYYFSGPLEKEQESTRTNLTYTTHDNIEVRDLREVENQLKLEIHGFQLLSHRSSVDLADPDTDQLQRYLLEVSNFIKNQLNAEVVLCYNYRFRRQTNHTTESTSAAVEAPIGSYKNQDKPVLVPHTDQTREGGPRRVRYHLSEEEAHKYLDGTWRIRILNCWRPLFNPADERPLAMCDYYSVKEVDLKSADRASREYVGEIYYMQYNESQKWYWISHQSPDELLLFVNYDSDPADGPAYIPHSSFLNQAAASDVKPRQSLETALIVITKK
ncbi:hypothetical protein BGAL_0087g00120 [Botrytis galanthina]|uniref:Methyltransferase n=1 Tax=Botrytis galanthina TaxID=278940 RepID=A0A4S8R5Q3_9HELO|nr:hypothetical protein BGAL_0087g00120 [Botrytis galanthina]